MARFLHDSGVTVPLILVMMLAACSVPSPVADDATVTESARAAEETRVEGNQDQAAASEGVAGLPFSHGRSFRTLDEYLEHLERYAAPIDQPWWREIRPGVYEHVKRMPGATREIATREELMRRFGFPN